MCNCYLLLTDQKAVNLYNNYLDIEYIPPLSFEFESEEVVPIPEFKPQVAGKQLYQEVEPQPSGSKSKPQKTNSEYFFVICFILVLLPPIVKRTSRRI